MSDGIKSPVFEQIKMEARYELNDIANKTSRVSEGTWRASGCVYQLQGRGGRVRGGSVQ